MTGGPLPTRERLWLAGGLVLLKVEFVRLLLGFRGLWGCLGSFAGVLGANYHAAVGFLGLPGKPF